MFCSFFFSSSGLLLFQNHTFVLDKIGASCRIVSCLSLVSILSHVIYLYLTARVSLSLQDVISVGVFVFDVQNVHGIFPSLFVD